MKEHLSEKYNYDNSVATGQLADELIQARLQKKTTELELSTKYFNSFCVMGQMSWQ